MQQQGNNVGLTSRGSDSRKSWTGNSRASGNHGYTNGTSYAANNNCQPLGGNAQSSGRQRPPVASKPARSSAQSHFSGTAPLPDDSRAATLEKLMCELIKGQGQRERVLLNQIASLHSELNRRSMAFQQTVNHFQRRIQQMKAKKQEERQAVSGDSDSGLGEDNHLTLHLAVILHRNNGSLGFNVSSGSPSSSPSQQHTKDLYVSRINSDGPAKGKLLLHDKILKVNGVDISEASHEDAVATFKAAVEPVVVEVSRLLPGWPRLQDAATQTGTASPSPSAHSLPPLTSSTTQSNADNCNSSVEIYEPREMRERTTTEEALEEELHKYDIEYEEVTLSKPNTETKLGLTLWCAEESESDVFIGEVDWSSVAGRDGRIQSGDQVIQINGVDVQTKSHAVTLFDTESSVISLVVARPHLRDEGTVQDASKDGYDCLHTLVNHYQHHVGSPLLPIEHLHPQSILEEDEEEVDEDETGVRHSEKSEWRTTEAIREEDEYEADEAEPNDDRAAAEQEGFYSLEKDSGVGGGKTTDGSTLNEEGSERGGSGNNITTATLTFPAVPTTPTQNDRTASLAETHQIDNRVNNDDPSATITTNTTGNHHDYEEIGPPLLLPSATGRLNTVGGGSARSSESVEQWVESTAVAVNGHRRPLVDEELCLGMFLPPPPSERDPDDALSVYSCDCCPLCVDSGDGASSVRSGAFRPQQQQSRPPAQRSAARCVPVLPIPPAATVYTDRNGLARTIRLQQQLFRRALLASTEVPPSPSRSSSVKSPSSPGRSVATSPCREPPPSPPLRSPSTSSSSQSSCIPIGAAGSISGAAATATTTVGNEQQEWKVKRRSDGTRHIVRRPVRSRQLRERAIRVAEERCGVTTDDDAVSELKVGRYWTKEERRHHLERARQRRVEMSNRGHNHNGVVGASGGGGCGNGELAGDDQGILELSRRKMMRLKGKTLFDDFTTVQEVLVHGSRTNTNGTAKVPHSLLSVTTV